MAQHFIKASLSASINGAPITISATATAGTTIHTATSSSTLDSVDEVWLWGNSIHTSAVNITLYLGGATGERFKSHHRVPAAFNGPVPLIPGIPFMGGAVITATASVGDVINVFGFINRIGGQTTS